MWEMGWFILFLEILNLLYAAILLFTVWILLYVLFSWLLISIHCIIMDLFFFLWTSYGVTFDVTATLVTTTGDPNKINKCFTTYYYKISLYNFWIPHDSTVYFSFTEFINGGWRLDLVVESCGVILQPCHLHHGQHAPRCSGRQHLVTWQWTKPAIG